MGQGYRHACPHIPRRRAPAPHERARLHDPRHLLRGRARHRLRRQGLGQDQPRLLPLRPLTARLDHRPRLHLRQPRRDRDPGDGREQRAVRRLHRALVLDRRHPRHGVPGPGDDAVLLRLEGPLGPGVPAPALRQGRTPAEFDPVRLRRDPDRGRQPVLTGDRGRGAARLAAVGGDRDRRVLRPGVHHARRSVLGDLQRGAAVLRDPRGPDPDRRARPEAGRRLGRSDPLARQDARQRLHHRLGRYGHRACEPAGRELADHRPRPRLRPLLRLLDDELRGGAARSRRRTCRRPSAPRSSRRSPRSSSSSW